MISVAICTYNRVNKIVNILKDLNDQIEFIDEVIVVESGPENTFEKILNLNLCKDKLKYYYLPKITLGEARNYAAKSCNSEYILFSDDDDNWDKLKVKILIEYIKLYNPDVLYHQFQVRRNNKIIPGWSKKINYNFYDITRVFWSNYIAGGSSFGFKTNLINYFPYNQKLKSLEDAEWWIRVLNARITILFIPKILTTYNEHSGRMTNNTAKIKYAYYELIKFALTNSITFLMGAFLSTIRVIILILFKR